LTVIQEAAVKDNLQEMTESIKKLEVKIENMKESMNIVGK